MTAFDDSPWPAARPKGLRLPMLGRTRRRRGRPRRVPRAVLSLPLPDATLLPRLGRHRA